MPGLSNWREEFNLSEVVTGKMTDKEALKKVSEKSGINNKVTINPKLDEAVKEIGGEVISMVEADTKAQHQRLDMKQMILDRQKLKLRRKDMSQAKQEKKNDVEGDSSNAMKQSNVIAQEAVQGQDTATRKAMAGERKAGYKRVAPGKAKQNAERIMQSVRFYDKITKGKHVAGVAEGVVDVKKENEKKRKNALQIQKVIGEELVNEADPRLALYQSGMTDASRVKGRVGKAVDKVKDKVKKVLGKKDKVSSHLDRYRFQSGLDNYLKSKVKKEEVANEDYYSGTGEKVQKRTKKWMDKKGQSGAPGLDAMKAREAEHKARRGVKKEEVVLEKDLNAAERRALPDSDFALPGKGKGPEGKQAGSYPIPDATHARAALAMVAKYGTPEEKEKVRAAVKRKFPDIQQEGLVEPKGVDSAKEVNKATRKAAFRPFHKEDKAFDYVVAKLRKQHGKDAVLTKGDKMPEPSAAQKKKNAEIRAKRAKEDHRDPTEIASSGRYSDRYSNRGSD